MSEFEQQLLAELRAIRVAVESMVSATPDAFTEFLATATPSPRTIDEWYESSLYRSIALEAVGDDE